MNGMNLFNRLVFDDNRVFHDEVKTERVLKNEIVIFYGLQPLPVDRQASLPQFVRKAGFINALDQAGPNLRCTIIAQPMMRVAKAFSSEVGSASMGAF